MTNISPQTSFFQFPQSDGSLFQSCQNNIYSPPSPPFQWYEMYAALASPVFPQSPTLVPFYETLMPSSPFNYSHTNFMLTPFESEEKVFKNKNLGDFIDGVPVEQWKSMTDNEREEFLKIQRRQEAFKTSLCQAYKKFGSCKYGLSCRFAHGLKELRPPNYSHPKYKTVLCRNYAVKGGCPYGPRCQFIHEKFKGPIPQEYISSIDLVQLNKTSSNAMNGGMGQCDSHI